MMASLPRLAIVPRYVADWAGRTCLCLKFPVASIYDLPGVVNCLFRVIAIRRSTFGSRVFVFFFLSLDQHDDLCGSNPTIV